MFFVNVFVVVPTVYLHRREGRTKFFQGKFQIVTNEGHLLKNGAIVTNRIVDCGIDLLYPSSCPALSLDIPQLLTDFKETYLHMMLYT
jgi:hypothetical protein